MKAMFSSSPFSWLKLWALGNTLANTALQTVHGLNSDVCCLSSASTFPSPYGKPLASNSLMMPIPRLLTSAPQ